MGEKGPTEMALAQACPQLAYLVSRRRRVNGWVLARDLLVAAWSVL
jgi:hypothetical protein